MKVHMKLVTIPLKLNFMLPPHVMVGITESSPSSGSRTTPTCQGTDPSWLTKDLVIREPFQVADFFITG